MILTRFWAIFVSFLGKKKLEILWAFIYGNDFFWDDFFANLKILDALFGAKKLNF